MSTCLIIQFFCLSKLFAKYNLRIIKVEKNNNQNGSIIGYVVHKDLLIKPDNTKKNANL